MADRVTKEIVSSAFDLLLRITGNRRATDYNDVGGWRLDYNPTYGGVVVEEVINPGGGVTHPLVERRFSPAEFVNAVHFARWVVEARDRAAARGGGRPRA